MGSSSPRKDALSWDDYFMSLAFLTAMRSKDPSTQVGACIVNDRNRIVGVGYNGMPSNCPSDQLPWSKVSPEGELETKYPYVVHAELNAVLNKNAESCSGCRIYTTLFPCNECAKVIIQAGIKQVIFASDKQKEKLSAKASRRLFELANVELRQHVPEAELLQLPLRYTEEAKAAKAAKAKEAPMPALPPLPSQSKVIGQASTPRLGLPVLSTIACDSHTCGCGTATGDAAVAPGCRLGTGAAAVAASVALVAGCALAGRRRIPSLLKRM
mmetsp:Transcript_116409/g.163666  ORF Transcript_116409/g.163666 Transcript_116409/m.163666 type:complete len:270 (+) Transcript_116409:57-866(+)